VGDLLARARAVFVAEVPGLIAHVLAELLALTLLEARVCTAQPARDSSLRLQERRGEYEWKGYEEHQETPYLRLHEFTSLVVLSDDREPSPTTRSFLSEQLGGVKRRKGNA
jgi:hypothetical protein